MTQEACRGCGKRGEFNNHLCPDCWALLLDGNPDISPFADDIRFWADLMIEHEKTVQPFRELLDTIIKGKTV
jgi:hypothetical protein